ncbi:MAG: hypothetical protein MUC36_07610 [Planctomycetes bacterium]|jgi:hypothetical protein|nr:hypothetical protein [Planctomycetota bacterium]
MPISPTSFLAATAAVCLFSSFVALPAQCGIQWRPFQGAGGLDGRAEAVAVLPNGDLVVGGNFRVGDNALCTNIARFDGSTWRPLGAGCNATVHALAVLPNGDLVAGGEFTEAGGLPALRVARWNGAAWAPLGGGCSGTVLELLTLASGQLFVAGTFTTAGGAPAARAAQWNGTSWSAMGAGLAGTVLAATQLTTGEVVVGGGFAGGIATWNGSTWTTVPGLAGVAAPQAMVALPGGLFAAVGTFAFGTGPFTRILIGSPTGLVPGPNPGASLVPTALAALTNGDFAIGLSAASNGSSVLRWSGGSWQGLGTGAPAAVRDLRVAPNGDLIAVGIRQSTQGVAAPAAARLSAGTWNRLGQAVTPEVNALAALPGGDVVLGGSFQSFGGVAANNLVRRTGSSLLPLGLGVNGPVLAMDVAPDGSLVVAGNFTTAGGSPAIGVARWTNGVWSSLGNGTTLTAVEVAAGTGGEVLVRGNTSLRYYNGLSWSTPTLPGSVSAIVKDPAGGFLVGGLLGFPNVGTVRFVQGAFSFTVNQPLVANAFGQDRNGRPLAAVDNGGNLRVLRLDGGTWSQIGPDYPARLAEQVTTMPNGDVLVATAPTIVGGAITSELIRLDGPSWVPVQNQLLIPTATTSAKALSVLTTDRGELFVGGQLRAVAGQVAFSIAVADAQCPATVAPFGAGCNGGSGPLLLTARNAAWTGSDFLAQVSGLAANAAAVQVVGTATSSVALPSSAGGCFVYTAPLILSALSPSGGAAVAGFAVPRSVALAGLTVRMQVVGVEVPATSLLRLASSNALDVGIGSW